jgi:hypothetical protein
MKAKLKLHYHIGQDEINFTDYVGDKTFAYNGSEWIKFDYIYPLEKLLNNVNDIKEVMYEDSKADVCIAYYN